MNPIVKAVRELALALRWSNLKAAYAASLAKVDAERAAKHAAKPGRRANQ